MTTPLLASSALGMLAPIGILLAMVLVMYWLSRMARKRLGMGSGTLPQSALKVVGKRTLEPRKSLYVVELGDRYILVGTGENQVNLIDHISADEFAAMATDAEQAPRLRVARNTSVVTDDDELAATGTEQRFATVGESFAHVLGKVRSRSKTPTDN